MADGPPPTPRAVDTRDIPQSQKPPAIIPPCRWYELVVGWFRKDLV